MLIPLDIITRKKLILVKQIYQRALIQSQATHSYVDRIFAVVGFDLANETVLKAVVSALNPSKKLANDFQGILSQAENELTPQNLTIPDKVKIQHVRTLRNDAQHKAKYPNETDVSDCRTYTRDFLIQTFSDVWGESFESISLIDVIQNDVVKSLLLEAEQDFVKNDYTATVTRSMAAFQQMTGGLANSLTRDIKHSVSGIVVEKSYGKTAVNNEIFDAFIKTRELIVFQIIGINPQEYLKYKLFTGSIHIASYGGGKYASAISGRKPIKEEAEYVLNFVINSIVQIESLDKDITQRYKR